MLKFIEFKSRSFSKARSWVIAVSSSTRSNWLDSSCSSRITCFKMESLTSRIGLRSFYCWEVQRASISSLRFSAASASCCSFNLRWWSLLLLNSIRTSPTANPIAITYEILSEKSGFLLNRTRKHYNIINFSKALLANHYNIIVFWKALLAIFISELVSSDISSVSTSSFSWFLSRDWSRSLCTRCACHWGRTHQNWEAASQISGYALIWVSASEIRRHPGRHLWRA